MLLTFPVEIQAHILAHLPRRDLASVVRTCSELHAAAVRFLYEHVELHSFDQVEAFFHIGGAPAISMHVDTKRVQWERMKTLAITIAPDDSGRELGPLPPSLSGPNAGPLQLDRLRLTYEDEAFKLVVLLQCMNPTELGLCRTSHVIYPRTDVWATLLGWNEVAHVMYARPMDLSCGSGYGPYYFHPPFVKVTSADIVLSSSRGWMILLDIQIRSLVALCPNLEHIVIRADREERFRAMLKIYMESADEDEEMGGQPGSLFSVEDKPDGSNIWGEVDM